MCDAYVLRMNNRASSLYSRTALMCVVALLLGSFIMCARPDEAAAAFARKSDSISMEEATNPKPADDDFLLPMPCGGTMAFRVVGVESEGFLWDLETSFGSNESNRAGRDYYERRYSAAVSGPFSARDFPESQRGKLPKAQHGQYHFYLIGKYEISNFQWKAVMENWCPSAKAPLTPDDALPKTNITWFDAVNFAHSYMQWLLENKAGALPLFTGDKQNTGFLRLPSEAEWEYAARGGHQVSGESLRHNEFFPMSGSIEEYAAFRADNASYILEAPRRIGSLLPNPIGVYDMQGNASEMVMDAFRFSVGGRMHGSAGGFTRKGGSYLSGLSEILPGRREEVAFYQSGGASYAKDMGMRLVLSGINTPQGDRLSILEKEWKVAGESRSLLLEHGKDPLEEIDRIIKQSKNSNEKENLTRLRAVLKDNNIVLERRNNKAAEGVVRSSIFMVDAIKSYALRLRVALSKIESESAELEHIQKNKALKEELKGQLENDLRGNATQEQKEQLKKLKLLIANDETAIKDYTAGLRQLHEAKQVLKQSLLSAVHFYRDKIDEGLHYPDEVFKKNMDLVRSDLGKSGLVGRNLKIALDLYDQHVKALRQGKMDQLNDKKLLDSILPKSFLSELELSE